ncbi:MAG: type II toxin-antitoxin system VapB family antitoxin [Myxococcales bacterium]|nr:type II toxin-antitoxin system VapB family antitoxin [Myxococcales bacterium]MCB9735609.1 type II toxin-antitoxin system VapB family antitoxin [Deltaproteobacteria bacterium]
MKTTIEIADPILAEAREVAARERTTLRALVEEGLRAVVAARSERPAFVLEDAAFRGGQGLQPEFEAAGWDELRAAAYEGRGG